MVVCAARSAAIAKAITASICAALQFGDAGVTEPLLDHEAVEAFGADRHARLGLRPLHEVEAVVLGRTSTLPLVPRCGGPRRG